MGNPYPYQTTDASGAPVRQAGLLSFTDPANQPGGSQTATATVTTDPDAFTFGHLFDLGHASVATVTTTITAFTGDGETLGSAPGDIQLAVNCQASFDGSNFLAGSTGAPNATDGITTLTAIDGETLLGGSSLRYLRVQGDWEDSGFNEYSGPNHPVGTVHIVVEYV